jgi:hypothetical protein
MADMISAVVEELRARGYTAYNEYPGVVHVPHGEVEGYWAGNVNDSWGVDLQNEESGEVVNTWNTGVPRNCTDPLHIADAVEVVLRKAAQLSRPREWTKEAVVRRMKAEILHDFANGIVPHTAVENFSQLHDFVDANEYGGLCENDCPFRADSDEHAGIINAAQEEIDQWLHALIRL